MTADQPSAPERLAITTADGLRLRAEWLDSIPGTTEADGDRLGPTAVLCHPHPLHGGNMHATVIDQLFRTLPTLGVPAVRFNFRGVQGSDGRHDHGDRERLDVAAAVDMAVQRRPSAAVRLVGWSFGGDLALATTHEAIDEWIAIAPPLRVIDPSTMPAGADPRSTQLVIGEHDAFCPPATAADITARWVATEIETIAGADHFFGSAMPQLLASITGRF